MMLPLVDMALTEATKDGFQIQLTSSGTKCKNLLALHLRSHLYGVIHKILPNLVCFLGDKLERACHYLIYFLYQRFKRQVAIRLRIIQVVNCFLKYIRIVPHDCSVTNNPLEQLSHNLLCELEFDKLLPTSYLSQFEDSFRCLLLEQLIIIPPSPQSVGFFVFQFSHPELVAASSSCRLGQELTLSLILRTVSVSSHPVEHGFLIVIGFWQLNGNTVLSTQPRQVKLYNAQINEVYVCRIGYADIQGYYFIS